MSVVRIYTHAYTKAENKESTSINSRKLAAKHPNTHMLILIMCLLSLEMLVSFF